MIEVLASGPLATVQDLGRPGLADLGVSRSGAADRAALRLANRLVGNAESAAGIEVTLGGLVVRLTAAATVACTGARCPLTGHPGGWNAALSCPAGTVLALGMPAAGLRSYLAVRGGLAVPAVLGSRATDTLSGLGPPALAAGQQLPVGTATAGPPGTGGEVGGAFDPRPAAGQFGAGPVAGQFGTRPVAGQFGTRPVAGQFGAEPATGNGGPAEPVTLRPVTGNGEAAEPVTLRVAAGPRAEWFETGALGAAGWRVRPDSDRIGTRLAGPALRMLPGFERLAGELPSEPTLPGAVQVPPDGQPIVFGPDAPVTGGYPVVGVLVAADLDLLAQQRPGAVLRFVSLPTGPRYAAAGRPR